MHLGKNAALSGLQAAAIAGGFTLVKKVVSGEPIESDKLVETALSTGADAGVKAAAAGALKVGVEKGIISIIPQGTPAGVIANIACVAIENAKILAKVAKGELTVSQGLEHMGRTTTSMTYGLTAGLAGMKIGAAALSWIPFVGPVVGGLVGGIVGYAAGSKFGETVFNGLKSVGQAAIKAFKSTCESVKSFGRRIVSKIFA